MSVKKFRFVSPGVFVSEIDKSQLPRIAAGIGPIVIGRSLRGPGLVPVTVSSYEEFVEKFGNPVRGTSVSDAWRDPNKQSPMYGSFAAQAYLKNASPLTFVRLLGSQASEQEIGSGDKPKAGWNCGTHSSNTNAYNTNGGAYGLFIMPTGSNVVGTLAAVFYLTKGSIRLSGTNAAGANVGTNGAGTLVKSIGSSYEFRAQIVTGSNANDIKDLNFNFNPSSAKYIRKVFNTNPVLTNTEITPADVQKTYWLGETFADSLEKTVAENNGSSQVLGLIVPLTNGTKNAGNFKGVEAQPAKTGWTISQDLSTLTASYSPANMRKLFRFSALNNGGEWEQNNLKISIMDIKSSTNDFYKFGSFTVAVRKVDDTDAKPQYLEVFTNCNLDPNSTDFIANKIGDQYLDWDKDLKKYRRFGSFLNKSSYIRVELSEALENGELDPEVLPFGMQGPDRFKSITLRSGSAVDVASFIRAGSSSMPDCNAESDKIGGMNASLTASLVFPSLQLRVSASDAKTLDPRSAFYGVVTTKADSTSKFNEDYVDLVRIKPDGTDSHVEPSWYFSLDDVVMVENSSNRSYWLSGSRASGLSLTAKATSSLDDPNSTIEGYKAILDKEINRFTMPMVGGFDGLDITEKDPFRNEFLDSDAEVDNYAVYSLKQAIDAAADPEVVECNLITVPGVTDVGVTNHLINVAENRADTLAIIDLPGGYVPSHENSDSESLRLGSVKNTVNLLKNRGLNSSYACAYYPWVKIVDSQSGFPFWAPPSIAALGTMASSEQKSELWFAPAGFNRGGLSEGSAGISVVDVRDKLSQKDRDKLYEVNINPIASFPNEGIVIFGQKTLQVTPSALDRINVRRLMIFVKKQVSRAASSVLFDQNVKVTWSRFTGVVEPFLSDIKARFGLTDYRVVLDETTTTAELIDRNTLYAKIYLKPARAIEFIALDFIITRTGASFDD